MKFAKKNHSAFHVAQVLMPILQCFTGVSKAELRSHVTNQVNVIVKMAYKVLGDVMCSSARVPDELPL